MKDIERCKKCLFYSMVRKKGVKAKKIKNIGFCLCVDKNNSKDEEELCNNFLPN